MYIFSQHWWNVLLLIVVSYFLFNTSQLMSICLLVYTCQKIPRFFNMTFNSRSMSQKFLYKLNMILFYICNTVFELTWPMVQRFISILTTRQLYRFSNLFSNFSKSPANSEISLNNFNISCCESTPSSGLASLLMTGRTLSHI